MHGESVVKKSCVSSGWRPSFVSSAFLNDLVSCDLTIGFFFSLLSIVLRSRFWLPSGA